MSCIEHITYCSEETLVFNSRLTAVTSGRLFCNCRSQNGQEEFPTAPLYKKFSGRLLWRSCLRISIRLRSYPLQKIDRLLLNPFRGISRLVLSFSGWTGGFTLSCRMSDKLGNSFLIWWHTIKLSGVLMQKSISVIRHSCVFLSPHNSVQHHSCLVFCLHV